jgi:TRAP-type uncharacterized transport system substrate-binding protein
MEVSAGGSPRLFYGNHSDLCSCIVIQRLLYKALSEEYGVDTKVRKTAGSAANIRLLNKGFVQLAMAQADVTDDAYRGEGIFKENGALKGYGAVAALYGQLPTT